MHNLCTELLSGLGEDDGKDVAAEEVYEEEKIDGEIYLFIDNKLESIEWANNMS